LGTRQEQKAVGVMLKAVEEMSADDAKSMMESAAAMEEGGQVDAQAISKLVGSCKGKSEADITEIAELLPEGGWRHLSPWCFGTNRGAGKGGATGWVVG
jgi:hypothetical protein